MWKRERGTRLAAGRVCAYFWARSSLVCAFFLAAENIMMASERSCERSFVRSFVRSRLALETGDKEGVSTAAIMIALSGSLTPVHAAPSRSVHVASTIPCGCTRCVHMHRAAARHAGTHARVHALNVSPVSQPASQPARRDSRRRETMSVFLAVLYAVPPGTSPFFSSFMHAPCLNLCIWLSTRCMRASHACRLPRVRICLFITVVRIVVRTRPTNNQRVKTLGET